MVDSGSGADGAPVFGWRRATRASRTVLPAISSATPNPGVAGVQSDEAPSADQVTACPWLYAHSDPDARAAFVTADHRCEIRPDEVPGPGHQLAYCLTPNHVSCPQLLSYEAQRRAVAAEPRIRPLSLAAAQSSRPTSRNIPTPQVGGIRDFALNVPRSSVASRFAWAAAGMAATLAFVAGLAIIASPDDASSANGTAVPEASVVADQPESSAGQPAPGFAAPAGIDATVVVSSGADAAEAEPTADPNPVPVEPQVYVVAPGDTLAQIARDFGTEVDALIEANAIASGAVISVGDELVIPPAGAESE